MPPLHSQMLYFALGYARAVSHAVIWTGGSEVGIPESSALPIELAWIINGVVGKFHYPH